MDDSQALPFNQMIDVPVGDHFDLNSLWNESSNRALDTIPRTNAGGSSCVAVVCPSENTDGSQGMLR
jgi:hypothetical protein